MNATGPERNTCRPGLVLVGALLLCWAGMAMAVLPNEPQPRSEVLDPHYPHSWIFADDVNFYSILDGKVVILDVAAKSHNYKGAIPAGQFASFIESSTRPELYVAETYYSRRVRGTRHDVITLYDKSTLSPIADIPLPGGKRGQIVTLKNTLRLLNGERWLLVYNFTPATSVTIVDVVARKVLGTIAIGGCSLIYPSGKRQFFSLCGDGSMLVTNLDKDGAVSSQVRTKPFFDPDKDPLFTKTVLIGGAYYFPSFHGEIQPVDVSGAVPKVLKKWSLIDEKEKAQAWRPGGWQLITADKAGRMYVLMHEHGYNGSHKNPGSEVWVFDPRSGKRVERLKLKAKGISILATSEDKPHLVVTNADFNIDVYDAQSGDWERMIGDHAAIMPFVLFAVK